jgi:predicted HAD superfamily phosphohydrolase YqeG
MTAQEAQEALLDVAVSSNRATNRIAYWLAAQAFLKAVVGAAALADIVGSKPAGLALLIVSGLDAATAAYLAATNRNPVGSG